MKTSTLVYSTRSGNPSHARAVAMIANARTRPTPMACRLRTPEPHESGEFPMSCGACHAVANG